MPLTFDILIPTRERPDNMLAVMRSLKEHSALPGNITVAFYVDHDDEASKAVIASVKDLADGAFKELLFIMGERRPLVAAYNELAAYTNGDIIMYAADDIEFVTQGWDEMVADFFWESKDRIWLVWAFDPARPASNFPDHGFISRWGRNAVKYVFPSFGPHPKIPGSVGVAYTDVWLHAMYGFINRLKYLPDITIAHKHWHRREEAGGPVVDMDRTYFCSSIATQWRITPEYVVRNNEIPQHAEMLKQVIDFVERESDWLAEAGLAPFPVPDADKSIPVGEQVEGV